MARRTILDDVTKVEKNLEVKSEIIRIINIPDEKLIDYPDNNEDVSYTEDLELSMKENGFTDPIEVTDYKMDEGFYMILSGHRRRQAGKKVGYITFPCIIRHFQSDQQFENYNLMSNAYRNAEKDPLLYVKRYAMHEKYLDKICFNGDKATEISKRLGMSRANALRYKQMNKVILPVWDMVSMEQVGMSNILFMSKYDEEEQLAIYEMLKRALNEGNALTRDYCNEIKEKYERTKAGIDEEQIPGQESIETLEGGAYMPDEYVAEPVEPAVPVKMPEPIPAENILPVTKTAETPKEVKPAQPTNTKEEVFFHYLSKVDEYLTGNYVVSSKENSIKMIKLLHNIILESMVEINNVAKKHDLEKMAVEDFKEISLICNNYMK